MDIDTKCLSVFKSFISDIIKVFPEHDTTLHNVYGSLLTLETCKLEEQELLQEFLERVHKVNKKITNKDESLFMDDELILTDISFKDMWTTNISYKTKETIWKYLQTFCLLALNHQSNKDLQNALSDLNDNKTIEITDKKVASDVKKIKKMTENIQEPIAEDISTTNQNDNINDNPFAAMEQMMQSSEIGKIAQQVSESLDIESMLGSGDSDNPMELLQNLMTGDAMSKIMGTIHNVVNDKVESGELNRDSMKQEAEGMYQNMGSNPLFQAMSQMQGQQGQQQPEQQGQPEQAQQQPKPSNKTQARLQKKLKEREKTKVTKLDE